MRFAFDMSWDFGLQTTQAQKPIEMYNKNALIKRNANIKIDNTKLCLAFAFYFAVYMLNASMYKHMEIHTPKIAIRISHV